MSEHDARDPFVGINQHIRKEARGQYVPAYAIGKVISTSPLVIRADGMDLDKEDLLVPAHLTKADWPVVSTLPYRVLEGSYNQTTGKVTVIRPSEKLRYAQLGRKGATGSTSAGLAQNWRNGAADPDLEGWAGPYCVVERMVRPDEPVSAD